MPQDSPAPVPDNSEFPDVIIAWDPTLITAEQYAALVLAIGELVRSEGCAGIERIRAQGQGVQVGDGVAT